MNIEEDVMLVQKPMVSVPFAIQNMLSTTRSFFDHRNTVRWDESQMLASQQACFDADWLRCVEGPLSFLFPPATMANTETEAVDGSQSLLASEAQILQMETTRSILSEHYGKLEHIFSLYAAAEGGPYELGQQGATQLFLDLRMLLTDEEARVEGERQEAEEMRRVLSAPNLNAARPFTGGYVDYPADDIPFLMRSGLSREKALRVSLI